MAFALFAASAPAVLSQEPPPPPRFDTELTPPPPVVAPAAPSGPAYRQATYAYPPSPGAMSPAAGPRRLPSDTNPLPDAGDFRLNAEGPAGAYPPRDGHFPAVGNAPPDSGHPAGGFPAVDNRAADPSLAPGTPGLPPFSAAPPMPAAKVFEPGQIIAWVGDQPIQTGDIMPTIEQMLAPALAKMSPEEIRQQQDQIDEQKQRLLQQALTNSVETKLLYLDFLRTLPDDKRKEILPNITKRAEEQFYEKQLPDAIKRAKVDSAIELDVALRRYGSSVAEQKRLFVERILGQSVLGQKIDYEPEVTHQEMLDYYHEHTADFTHRARARWEILTVRFDQFSNKSEAWAALGQMGNEVLRGAPLAAVARRHSQGADAQDGGYHDWTTQGSLASEALDQAIFTLPRGRLSERIEDERGFHIVRVLEREEAGRTPFVDAQVEIKEAIHKQKVRQQITDYVAKLRSEIAVWTIFDAESQSPEATTAAKPPIVGNTPWPSTYQRR
ncbi:MAG: peptidyl-prolyl cis-trans isomerase [Planctomycetes bacterium]|nr:peptidyl-prolyl cis-trans isomerase [Planctomycetota bacterium]